MLKEQGGILNLTQLQLAAIYRHDKLLYPSRQKR